MNMSSKAHVRDIEKYLKQHLESLKESVDSNTDYTWTLGDDGSMDTIINVCDVKTDRCRDFRTNPDFEGWEYNIADDLGIPVEEVGEILESDVFFDILDDIRVYSGAEIALQDAWQFLEDEEG